MATSSLSQMAERLAAVASRLGGSQLGHELREISEELRREAESQTLGTTAELLAAVGRAREEREELRLALAQQAALAAERELELRLELEQLQEQLAQKVAEDSKPLLPADVQAQIDEAMAFALAEEAKIARAARAYLVEANESLSAALDAERRRSRAAQTEAEALRTLLACQDVLGELAVASSAGTARGSLSPSPPTSEAAACSEDLAVEEALPSCGFLDPASFAKC
ncbi:unnamed protein product [Symbiodinium sp. CCMP2592]|nr:unnamed protein product [Symbiodinium sp. CCMP2592]